ncbi:unnamed protein product [marine sediment metagenome]|uniref:DUF2589 domain-containing protein n=1 Tax=marine sediment metagenome TaxID=412755 RepID=X1CAS3_9ZZZZ
MPTPGQELSSIDFESMLGGPLVAVINAQAQAAIATTNFIKEVGFKKKTTVTPGDEQTPEDMETEEPIYVSFKYPKETSPYTPAVYNDQGVETATAKEAVYETQVLEVPILTMLPIPFIRIEETTIDFNAKINSTTYCQTDTSLKIDASTQARAGFFWASAKLKVSTSYQRSTTQGKTVNRDYSLQIHVRAVQDEIPPGMDRLLSILENVIISKPAPVAVAESTPD